MKTLLVNIVRFYVDGFREMTLGRILWFIILVKLFVLFFVLKLFFFPDFLNTVTGDDETEGDYVGRELIHRVGERQPQNLE